MTQTISDSPRSWSWRQISLAKFLILVAVASGIIGLVVARVHRSYQRNQAFEMVLNAGGAWTADHDRMAIRGPAIDDDFVGRLAMRLGWVPELREVGLVETAVTDEGLLALSRCSTLTRIYVLKCKVTPEGIAKANGLRPELKILEAQPDPIATKLAMMPIYRHAVVALAFTSDGEYLLAGMGDGRLQELGLFGTFSRRAIAAHKDWLFDIAVSPNGKIVATAGGDNKIRLWHPRSLAPIAEIDAHDDDVHAVQWVSDRQLVSAGDDCTIRKWEVVTQGNAITLHPLAEPITAHNNTIPRLRIHPNHGQLLSASRDHSIGIWKVGGEIAAAGELHGHQDDVMDLAVSPDGRRAISIGYDGALCDWDLTSRLLTRRVPVSSGRLYALSILWDSQVAIVGGAEGLIRVDLQTGKVIARHNDQPVISRVCVAPTADLIATASADGRILLRHFDLRLVHEIQLYDEGVDLFFDEDFRAASR